MSLPGLAPATHPLKRDKAVTICTIVKVWSFKSCSSRRSDDQKAETHQSYIKELVVQKADC